MTDVILAADAKYGELCLIAEDTFSQHPTVLQPPPDPRLATMGYTVLGHVTAVDQVFDLAAQRVCYGMLLRSMGARVLAFRGTEKALEWAKDAEGAQLEHPSAGRVHAGFWNIYESARFLTPDGREQPLIAGVLDATPSGSITWTGHSLGAPLATYGAYDCALMRPGQVSARLLASPRPGDGVFSAAASAAVKDHVSYAYAPDEVPKVPFGFGYAPLANFEVIPSNPRVRGGGKDWAANHHAWVYTWLLDPATAESALCGAPQDAQYAGCILPEAAAA